MKRFFKKKQPPPEAMTTFKERVHDFHTWFLDNEELLFNIIESEHGHQEKSPDAPDLATFVSETMNVLLPHFAWVFGPGPEEKGGHSFTLSGEGVRSKQLLSEYWLAQAPKLDRWTFHPSRQANGAGEVGAININDVAVRFDEVWVTPTVDETHENADLLVWHPHLESLPEDMRMTLIFIMLDEVLGEYGTGHWVGNIEIADHNLADAIPITELGIYTQKLAQTRQWNKTGPTETWGSYSLDDPPGGFLRGDAFVGTTLHYPLIRDYLNQEGKLEDPLEGVGADFVFASIDSSILPKGNEVDFRTDIGDAIDLELKAEGSGMLIGGATGREHAYIDFLVVDGERSLDIIMAGLKDHGLPAGTGLHFFAQGNEGRRRYL